MAEPVEIVVGKKYQLWAKVKDPLTGKWRRETRMFEGGIRAARDAMAAFRAEVRGHTGTKVGTVGHVFETYLEDLRVRGRSEKYLVQSEGFAKEFVEWYGETRQLDKLDKTHLARFYADLQAPPRKLAANTIHHYHAFLKPAFKLAVGNGWLSANPADFVTLPTKTKPLLPVPSPDEVEKLLQTALEKEHWQCFVFFCVAVGLSTRRGELLALRWSDIDFDRGTVYIEEAMSTLSTGHVILKDTKAHNKRKLTLLEDDLAQLLREHQAWQKVQAAAFSTELVPDPFLFALEADGAEPMHPDTVSKAWRRVAKATGLKYRLHDLRHFGATEALSAGVPMSMVSYRLGHERMSTTLDIYGHHRPDLDVNMSKFMSEMLKFPLRPTDELVWQDDSTPPSGGSPSQ